MTLILPQRGRLRQPAAVGGGAVTKTDIVNLSPYAFWSMSDAADRTVSGTDVLQIDDLSGNGFHLVDNATNDPQLDTTGGVNSWVPASDAGMVCNFGASPTPEMPASCSLFMTVKTTDTNAMLTCAQTSIGYLGVFTSGNSNTTLYQGCGTPSFNINGSAFSGTTRGDLYSSIATGSWMVIEAHNLNLFNSNNDLWQDMYFGYTQNLTAYNLSGSFSDIIIISSSNLSAGAGEAANRATIMSWLNAQVGL